jgi:hypothetical protein
METDDRVGDQESPVAEVAWAGLPVNLDLAFSQVQRDKVYLQHLTRTRWRALRAQARGSDVATEYFNAETG